MTDLGLMKALDEAGPEGLTLEALCEKSPCSDYAARSLLEVAVRFGVAQRSDEGRFSLTNTGIFFVNDLHVGINFRFRATSATRASRASPTPSGSPAPQASRSSATGRRSIPASRSCRAARRRAGSNSTTIIPTRPIPRRCRSSSPTGSTRSRTSAATPASGPAPAAPGAVTSAWSSSTCPSSARPSTA